IIGWMWIPV
nr:Chain C, ILE-ILE-GLY-TRP-MET-TRP-ILE-PRO-VAL [Homo sapiens]6Z9V_F Chain F, ILE-ILE-GLY-TRP-MET-TRP-ILE-PRO-VAL [Homo sapiens]